MTEPSDYELLVQSELTAIRLFGFDTYKFENNAKSAKLRAELDALDAEAARRGLKTDYGLTPAGLALGHESDPRVVALAEENRKFIQSRI